MSGQGTGDIPFASGSGLLPQKAIGSLARKPSDVTRQGTQKLKFVPTLPQRKKKEEVKAESASQEIGTSASDRGKRRGRGYGEGRGRGRDRGVPRSEVEMTASGPFAMGPALAGNSSAKRSALRSNVSIAGPTPSLTSASGRTSSVLEPVLDTKGKGLANKSTEDVEAYSEPDEGVEIIDMKDISQTDWMAPETLPKERLPRKIKKEERLENISLDSSDSEEVALEDRFTARANLAQDAATGEERLYVFQFPAPFPLFISQNESLVQGASTSTDGAVPQANTSNARIQSESSKLTASGEPDVAESRVDGAIGELVFYRSGAVKMRLANDILLDVTAASQPSFFQQAVYLDTASKKLVVLGEINQRFSVSPDIDALLTAMESADQVSSMPLEGENLIQMDTR